MNVVLVTFDTLRKDCVGCYGAPPWGPVHTPHLNALAAQSLVFDSAYPESFPTLPARRALYTGQRVFPYRTVDPALKGDFVGDPGWGPIGEDQVTLSEMFREAGYRTALISDVYHMFKPSKNFWRGFDQWSFIRGQEADTCRSGPEPTQQEIDRRLPAELQTEKRVSLLRKCLKNMHGRTEEKDYFCAQVFTEAARWLEQNRDADRFFLTIECFDPHQPWFVPEHYRQMYDESDGPDQVLSNYRKELMERPALLRRTRANYAGLVTMCDRWFGYFLETMRSLGVFDDTLLVVTSDHGHSLGERGYVGKHDYPAHRSVYDIVLMIRHPDGRGAGRRSTAVVQQHDLTAEILRVAEISPEQPLDGRPFLEEALANRPVRDHVTIGWGKSLIVITERWAMHCMADGSEPWLYDRTDPEPYKESVAPRHPDIVRRLYGLALADAGGAFPPYLLTMLQDG